jgi:hypothetical protein
MLSDDGDDFDPWAGRPIATVVVRSGSRAVEARRL